MKKGIFLCLMLVLAVFLLQCSDSTGPDKKDPTPDPTPVTVTEKALVDASNTFGLNLFREINDFEPADKNLFISPLSVSFALGMAYNGADGSTKDAMAATLALSGMPIEDVNQTFHDLIDFLQNLDPYVAMEIANSIWYRTGFPVYDDFININQKYFNAEVQEANFNDPQTANIINSWVNNKTKGKIEKIINPPIPPEMVMYLINAVYFKAGWTVPFAKELSMEMPFFFSPDNNEFRDFMLTDTTFMYFENDLFQAVDLPYGDKKYCMTVFLPAFETDIDQFISQLTDENYAAWIEGFVERNVELALPKFKFSYEITLNNVLSAMGMEIAFDHNLADFSKIASLDQVMGNLYISIVKHKSFVQVDEEGTEAAAVTLVGIGCTSINPDPSMIINRPFAFVVRDLEKGSIVFMGKIVDPVWED